MKALKLLILSALIFPILALSTVGQSPVTEWTTSDGKTFQATWVRLESSSVVLRKLDDTEIRIALSKLSAESQRAAINRPKPPAPPPAAMQTAFDKGAAYFITFGGLIANGVDPDVHFFTVNLTMNPKKEWTPFLVKVEAKDVNGRPVSAVVKPAGAQPGANGQFVFGITRNSPVAGKGKGWVHLVSEDSMRRLSNSIEVPIEIRD